MLLNASREDGLSYWPKHKNIVLGWQSLNEILMIQKLINL